MNIEYVQTICRMTIKQLLDNFNCVWQWMCSYDMDCTAVTQQTGNTIRDTPESNLHNLFTEGMG